MAPNGKKKADSPLSFEDVEAKRVEMVKSLSAVADAFEAATSSVRAYLECAPHALTEPPALAADGSKKRKAAKEKKVKDPNAPKRPVTGYLAYSKDQMPKLKEANPTMPHKVLVGLITEQWTNLPEEEKKVYNDTFSAAMAEWKGKTAEYKEHHENGAAPAAEASKPAAAKPAADEAQSGDEAGSDDDETASTASSDSSDSSETEEEDAKPQEADGSDHEEEEEDVPQPPAKRTKRDVPAATPSKSQQKPKSSSAAAVPTSSAKKAAAPPVAATPSAETSKKDKKSKKTEAAPAAAPASSEETPAKKRGRKPKAQ